VALTRTVSLCFFGSQVAANSVFYCFTGEKKLKIRLDDKFMLRYLRWLDFDPDLAFKKVLHSTDANATATGAPSTTTTITTTTTNNNITTTTILNES
jgi:hypothetical protein